MERLTRNLLAYRRRYLLGLAILAGLSLHSTSSLQYEQSVGYLFRTADTSEVATDAVNSDNTVMILIGLREELSRPAVEQLRQFEQKLEALDSVATVTSVFDARRPVRIGRMYLPVYPFQIESDAQLIEANQFALQHSLLHKQLLTADGRWMRLLVELADPGSNLVEIEQTLAPIYELVEHSLGNLGPDIYITGLPSLQLAIAKNLQRDQQFFIVIGALTGWLMAMLIFRDGRTVAVVVSGPLFGLLLIFGLMGLFGEPINPINVVIAPLAMTIALADAVHLQLEINRQRQLGLGREQAILESMRRVGPACILTAITTAIGFAALTFAEMLTIRELGILGGVTVVVALASVLLLVPLLSAGFLGNVPLRPAKLSLPAQQQNGRFAALACGSPKLLVLGGMAVIVLFTLKARDLQPDISISEALPKSSRASTALLLADKKFGGTSPIRIVISWENAVSGGWSSLLNVVQEVESAIECETLLAEPLSVHDLLRSLPPEGVPLEQRISEFRHLPNDILTVFVNTQRKETYLYTSMPDAGSQALIPVLQRVNQKIAAARQSHPSFDIQIEDDNVIHLHLADRLILSLLRGILSSVVLCSLVIAVGTRSVLLGVVSLLPNLLVLAGTAGVMAWAGLPLQLTSMTVFTIAYGIGVDDTIHFLRQYQLAAEESTEESVEARITKTLRMIVGPIVLTTLILITGLSGVLFSEIPSLFHFGALFIGALLWALIGDLLLLPAALICASKTLSIMARLKSLRPSAI